MFNQYISNYFNNSGYNSDNSDNSDNSNNYDNSSKSSNSSNFEIQNDLSKCLNSSNYSFTTDPIHYYRKDVLKQNQIKTLSRRKLQTQNYLREQRNKLRYRIDNQNYYNFDNTKKIKICQNIGYDSGLNKNTPFIDYLINKRINFCELGPSSHIAAFFPVSYNLKYCFLRQWKGKDNFG